MEKYYKTSEVARILGVHPITIYRYINQCTKCGEYSGQCRCKKPIFRMKAVDFSPEKSTQAEWRISGIELESFIRSRKRRKRRKDGLISSRNK